MFERVADILQSCSAISSLERDKEGPKDGIIYFQLSTDETFDENLRQYQPENSALIVEDGDVVEFDVRLGRWKESERDKVMDMIRQAATNARRQHYVPPVQIDQGGSHGFVPHIRLYQCRVVEEEFAGFLESLVKELDTMEKFR